MFESKTWYRSEFARGLDTGELIGVNTVAQPTQRYRTSIRTHMWGNRGRDLNLDAQWRYTIIDTDGTIIHIGTTRRRPTKPLSRLVETLQPTCAGPGCRIPASQCDFDHLKPWNQHGPTTDRNSGPKCRHDHQLKDHEWTHQRKNQTDIWTTPLGHTHTYPTNDDHPP